MKTPKLISIVIALLLSSFSLTFASNANVVSNDSTATNLLTNQQKVDSTALVQNSTSTLLATQQQLDEITTPILDALQTTVSLTSLQKETLKKKAEEYANKLLQAKAMSNKEDSYAFMHLVTESYQAEVEKTLTSEQKSMKEKKQKDQIDNQYKNSNTK